MSFQRKKIGWPQAERTWLQRFTSPFAIKIYTWVCIAIIVFFIGKRTLAALEKPATEAIKWVTKIVSKTVWEPLIQDEYGKVNVLVVWYAGDNYRGWLLTDTMMVASFDPKLWAVTFVSVPRDLYVNYDNGVAWRVNGLYRSHSVLAPDWAEHASWSTALMDKMSQITGIDVAYSVFVDFDGFVAFIDEIGWIDVDVPESLYDDQYPWENDSYTVFQVEQWVQQFDGETALKYARSRKSTSDFSRALRQQQIIAATVKQLTSQFKLTKVGNITKLYNSAMEVINTDIDLQKLLWLGQYAEWDKRFFSFVYTAECNGYNINFAEPWCFLYYGDRAQFGWQAVMIPVWAWAWNLSNYEQTSKFGGRVSRHQEVLIENPQITVLNGIDTQRARREWKNTNGIASEFAIELIEYWYTIEKVNNASVNQEWTTVILADTWANTNTVWSLRSFLDDEFDIVVDPLIASGRAWENVIQVVLGYEYVE